MRNGARARVTGVAAVECAAAAEAPDPTPTPSWRPTVTLHYAQSLDGRIATRTGAAQWISGDGSTRFAHELRAGSGAVIIGSGTALADDPLLTVRHVAGRHPLRVVLDARGRLPRGARLANDTTAPTVVATSARSLLAASVERWEVPAATDGEGVDLVAVLRRLRERGIESVLVEGGGRVITSFLRGDLVDRVIVTIAPMVLGAGVEAVGDLHTERLDQAKRFRTRRVWRLGDDVMIELAASRG